MFKVVSAEIKKILSKPGIYILSVLLALILVLGVFIYEPKVHSNNAVQLNGTSILTKYSNFEGDLKPNVNEKIEASISAVEYYRVSTPSGPITHEENITNALENFEEKLKNYLNCAHNSSIGVDEYISKTARPELIKSLEDLHKAVDTSINKTKQGSYVVLTTESNYEDYSDLYVKISSLLKTTATKDQISDIVNEYKTKYEEDFKKSINKLNYSNISDETILTYSSTVEGSKLSIVNSRLSEVEKEIIALKTKAQNGEIDPLKPQYCDEIDALATKYNAIADTYVNMVKYDLLSEAFDVVSTSEELNLLFLKNESEFNVNSLSIRYNYIFENNKTINDFANPLTIGTTSNKDINAYDYAYFILRLFSFIIIIYAVMAACHTIAGEIKEGSMRYYAIRPVSRSNIYAGKFVSILLMSVIMIIFSAVVALCVGGAVYGFDTLPILTIFNGSVATVMPPLAMLGIYLLSFSLELIVYLSIAMLLSCLIKSDLFAVTLMLVIYLINTLLPMFVSGANTWLAYYPFSHISLYSLFGSSVYAVSNNFFNLILGMKVYAGTSVILTGIVIALFIIIFNVLATKKFQNKEL